MSTYDRLMERVDPRKAIRMSQKCGSPRGTWTWAMDAFEQRSDIDVGKGLYGRNMYESLLLAFRSEHSVDIARYTQTNHCTGEVISTLERRSRHAQDNSIYWEAFGDHSIQI